MNFVAAMNLIGSNVWAFLAFLVGVFLVVHKIDVGHEIVVGAFALLRSGPTNKGDNCNA
jgi:hypothetical protein